MPYTFQMKQLICFLLVLLITDTVTKAVLKSTNNLRFRPKIKEGFMVFIALAF